MNLAIKELAIMLSILNLFPFTNTNIFLCVTYTRDIDWLHFYSPITGYNFLFNVFVFNF